MKTKKYYDENPKAYEKKKKYDKEYHSTEERKKYRAFLNKKNRQAGTYGNGDDLDASHTKSGRIVWEKQAVNRARNRGKK